MCDRVDCFLHYKLRIFQECEHEGFAQSWLPALLCEAGSGALLFELLVAGFLYLFRRVTSRSRNIDQESFASASGRQKRLSAR